MSKFTPDEFHLLAINAGIIGSIFIFFSIAAQLPPTTIFDIKNEECTFGFQLTSDQAQIAIVSAVGMLIIPFALSSILIIFRNKMASLITAIGFALIITTTILIISSLSCRIPTEFFSFLMVMPAMLSIIVVAALYYFKKKNAET
jgi:hypothetical protein